MTLTPTSLPTTIFAGRTGLLADFTAAWAAINQITSGGMVPADVSGLVSALAGKVDDGSLAFNIKDYGAVGNGSTDDTSAISSCLSAARATSSGSRLVEVHVPPGNYVIASSLNPGLCKINGYGATFTAKASTTSFNMLVSTTQEFSVFGLTVDQNKANTTYSGSLSTGVGIYSFRAAGGALGTYRDVTVKNSWCPGIRIGATVQTDAKDAAKISARIENATVDSCEYGVWCQGGGGAVIIGNTVTNCGSAGIWDNNSRNTVIANNYVLTTTGTNSSAITTAYSYGALITGNHCYGSLWAGVTVGGGATTWTAARYFRISNNHCEDNYYHGITIDTTISTALDTSVYCGGSITGNTCKHNGWTPTNGNGIYLQNASGVAVSGNMCENNYSAGIAMNGQRLAVAGNTCVDNSLYGIELRILSASSGDHNTYRTAANACYNNGANQSGGAAPKWDIFTAAFVTDSPVDLTGTGSPETVYTACKGSTFRRTDGGAGTCLYVKESGSGNTGWVAK